MNECPTYERSFQILSISGNCLSVVAPVASVWWWWDGEGGRRGVVLMEEREREKFGFTSPASRIILHPHTPYSSVFPLPERKRTVQSM